MSQSISCCSRWQASLVQDKRYATLYQEKTVLCKTRMGVTAGREHNESALGGISKKLRQTSVMKPLENDLCRPRRPLFGDCHSCTARAWPPRLQAGEPLKGRDVPITASPLLMELRVQVRYTRRRLFLEKNTAESGYGCFGLLYAQVCRLGLEGIKGHDMSMG